MKREGRCRNSQLPQFTFFLIAHKKAMWYNPKVQMIMKLQKWYNLITVSYAALVKWI